MNVKENLCKFCGSSIVKNGIIRNSQRYLCKNCHHKFYDNENSFTRMRTPTHVIISGLNMYFNGLSTRKVSAEINGILGEVSQVTVWSWVQKYSKIVSEFVETLRPSLSGKHHHDETEIKVGGENKYFWETTKEIEENKAIIEVKVRN
ncbi:MAG: transposase-like zinc-binding domain-containing protein [Nitrososphaerales archaeon]